jgi:uncharacterized LabA/DUF88 family protein
MLSRMRVQGNNFAFIDSQNVNLGVCGAGWKLDFAKFRVYLQEKYGVDHAYLFLGYLPGNSQMYATLQSMGYILVFKPVLLRDDGIVKGNCDAELVLQAMIDFEKYDRAIVATGDGDFHCLIQYLLSRRKLGILLVPNRKKFSGLLKLREFRPYLYFLNDLIEMLRYENSLKK